MKEFNLREELKNIKDNRRGQAQQHKLDVVLMITIMATMSGYYGYRAIGDFATRYKEEIIEYLDIAKGKVPSFLTVRRVLMNIDHEKFGDIFTEWMKHYMKKSNSQWVAVDGKANKRKLKQKEDE